MFLPKRCKQHRFTISKIKRKRKRKWCRFSVTQTKKKKKAKWSIVPILYSHREDFASIRATFFRYAYLLPSFHKKPLIFLYKKSLSHSYGVRFGIWLKSKLILLEASKWSIELLGMFINGYFFMQYRFYLVNRCKKLLEIIRICKILISVTNPRM